MNNFFSDYFWVPCAILPLQIAFVIWRICRTPSLSKEQQKILSESTVCGSTGEASRELERREHIRRGGASIITNLMS